MFNLIEFDYFTKIFISHINTHWSKNFGRLTVIAFNKTFFFWLRNWYVHITSLERIVYFLLYNLKRYTDCSDKWKHICCCFRLKLARLHTKFVCDVQYFNIRSLEISRMSIFMFGCKMCKVTWFCICVLFSTRITQAINELTKLLLFYVCDFHRNHFSPFKADIWIDFANTHLEISFITLTRNIV